MADTIYRLLGPNHNRLVTVVDDPKEHLGQISPQVAVNLRKHGWRPYAGSARAERGWVIAGTDEHIRPRALKAS